MVPDLSDDAPALPWQLKRHAQVDAGAHTNSRGQAANVLYVSVNLSVFACVFTCLCWPPAVAFQRASLRTMQLLTAVS